MEKSKAASVKSSRNKRVVKPAKSATEKPASVQEKMNFASLIGHLGKPPTLGRPQPAKARGQITPKAKSTIRYTKSELLALRDSPMAAALPKNIEKVPGLTIESVKTGGARISSGSAAFDVPFGSEGGEGSAVLSRHTRLSARVDALKQSTGGTRGPASPPSSPRLQRMFLTQDDAPGRNGTGRDSWRSGPRGSNGSDVTHGSNEWRRPSATRHDIGGRGSGNRPDSQYAERHGGRGRHHEDEALPEWATSGPLDINDTMDLHGFADDKRSIEEGLPDFFKTSGTGAGIGSMDILGGLEEDSLGGALEDPSTSTFDPAPAPPATEADFFSIMATDTSEQPPGEETTSPARDVTGARSRFFSRHGIAPKDEEDADGNFGAQQQRIPPRRGLAELSVLESTDSASARPPINASESKEVTNTAAAAADRSQMMKFFGSANTTTAATMLGTSGSILAPWANDQPPSNAPDAPNSGRAASNAPREQHDTAAVDRAAMLKHFGSGGAAQVPGTKNIPGGSAAVVDHGASGTNTNPPASAEPAATAATVDVIALPSADPWTRPHLPTPTHHVVPPTTTPPTHTSPSTVPPPDHREQSSLFTMLGKAGIVTGAAPPSQGGSDPSAVTPPLLSVATAAAPAGMKANNGVSRAFMPTSVIRKMGKKDGKKQIPVTKKTAAPAPTLPLTSSVNKPTPAQPAAVSAGPILQAVTEGGGSKPSTMHTHPPPQVPHPQYHPQYGPHGAHPGMGPPHSYQFPYQVPATHHTPYAMPPNQQYPHANNPPPAFVPDSFSGVGLNAAQANIMKLFGIGGASAATK